MFPITDSSQTIMDAIYKAAQQAGVDIWKNCPVTKIEHKDGKFQVFYLQECMEFDSVILATGSSKIGYEIAQSLGHSIVDPVPSLFTLSSKSHVSSENAIFHNLAGISVPLVILTLKIKGMFLHERFALICFALLCYVLLLTILFFVYFFQFRVKKRNK